MKTRARKLHLLGNIPLHPTTEVGVSVGVSGFLLCLACFPLCFGAFVWACFLVLCCLVGVSGSAVVV